MSKENKKNFSDVEYRFSFSLTINDQNEKNEDIIICKRDFNIYNFDEESLCSLELKECIDDVVTLIDRDLKSKSRTYLWYNYDPQYDNPEFATKMPEKDQTTFKFTLFDKGKVVISKIWSGDFYPFLIRNSVDLTNKKYKGENFRNVEMDFSKQIAQKASADRPDLTSIIMKQISSTCASYKSKDNKSKVIYKPKIDDLIWEEIIFSEKKGWQMYKNKVMPTGTVVDNNGMEKNVYNAYTTKYSVGDKEYDFVINNRK